MGKPICIQCGDVVRFLIEPTLTSESALSFEDEFLIALASERDTLRAQLSASQAREREAVERAEALAKNQAHIQERIQAVLGNGADEQAWWPGEHWLMAACRGLRTLATARKALEETAIDSMDFFKLTHYCRICKSSGPVETAIQHHPSCALFSAALAPEKKG